MKIALIAAMARNGVIGRENRLPWHLPEDLKYFRETTRGHSVIMGRKTFESICESIGRPLPQRLNIVLSRTGAPPPAFAGNPDLCFVKTADEALGAASARESASGTVFVIGGSEIYRLFLPRADLLYLTEVDADFEGDAFFPEWDRGLFREISRKSHPPRPDMPVSFSFAIYQRTTPDNAG